MEKPKRHRGRFFWFKRWGNDSFMGKHPDATAHDCRECPGLCCVVFKVMHECSKEALPGTYEAGANWVSVTERERNDMVPAYQVRPVSGCGYLSEDGCGIYETRPEMCKEFAPGSHNCEAIRYYFGHSVSEHFMKVLRKKKQPEPEVEELTEDQASRVEAMLEDDEFLETCTDKERAWLNEPIAGLHSDQVIIDELEDIKQDCEIGKERECENVACSTVS